MPCPPACGAAAAAKVCEAAGAGPRDVDVVEQHECFAQNELSICEAIAPCPESGACVATTYERL